MSKMKIKVNYKVRSYQPNYDANRLLLDQEKLEILEGVLIHLEAGGVGTVITKDGLFLDVRTEDLICIDKNYEI